MAINVIGRVLNGTHGVDNFAANSLSDLYRMTVDWNVLDVIDGGTGTDTLSYENADRGVTVTMAPPGKTGTTTAEFRTSHFVNPTTGQVFDTFKTQTVTQFKNIENVTGSGFNDKITGNSEANRIEGLNGKDEIHGGGGADVIIGGRGADSLFGDAGPDTFMFKSFTDSSTIPVLSSQYLPTTPFDSNLGLDVIRDFEVGVDKIDLSAIDANSLLQGNQAFTFVTSPSGIDPPSFSGTAGELIARSISVLPTVDTPGGFFWAVMGDIDGDAQWDFQITVLTPDSLNPITQNDFLL